MKNIHKVLKRKGIVVIWWADRPGRNMIHPSELKNIELFEEISLVGYPSGYRTNKGVVLEFYRKN